MSRLRWIAYSFALVIAASSAQPLRAQMSASKLVSNCESSQVVRRSEHAAAVDLVASAVCAAYLQGFIDASQFAQSRVFCLPAPYTLAETTDAFLAYTTLHPDLRKGLAVEAVLVAFHAVYPCPQGG
jgi:hypothetical protein